MATLKLKFIRNAASSGYTGDPMPELLNGGTYSKSLYKVGTATTQVSQDSFWTDIDQVRVLDIKSVESVKFCCSLHKDSTATANSYGYLDYAAKVSGVSGYKINYTSSQHFPTSATEYKFDLGSWTQSELCNGEGIHLYIKNYIRPYSVTTKTYISNCYVEINYTLNTYTISVKTEGGGTVTGGGSNFLLNDKTTIKATPDNGYRFVHWSDGNTDASRTITVTANTTYTAVFEKIETPPKFTSVKITPNPVIAGEACILTVGVE